ncbi:MAG: hypothetical protein ABI972_24155 [Acidobacteriota bacterium]
MVKIHVAVLVPVLALSAFGQLHLGGGGGGTGGGRGHGGGAGAPSRGVRPAPPIQQPFPGGGFGSVVNPSGVPQNIGIVNPIYNPGLSFGQRLGATVTGFDWAVGAYGRQRWRGGIVPVPVFIGSGYGGFDPYYQAPVPNVTVINAPQPSPTVIINQGYAPDRMNPQVTEVGPETPETMTTFQAPVEQQAEGRPLRESMRAPSNADGRPTVYLVAMKSGEVYTALAYWLEDGTLHYITTKHAHNRASFELVDTDMSRQLNQERGLEFTLGR